MSSAPTGIAETLTENKCSKKMECPVVPKLPTTAATKTTRTAALKIITSINQTTNTTKTTTTIPKTTHCHNNCVGNRNTDLHLYLSHSTSRFYSIHSWVRRIWPPKHSDIRQYNIQHQKLENVIV